MQVNLNSMFENPEVYSFIYLIQMRLLSDHDSTS